MLLAVVEASLIPETMALANTLTAPYRATVRWWQAEDMTQLTCTPPSAAYYGTSCWGEPHDHQADNYRAVEIMVRTCYQAGQIRIWCRSHLQHQVQVKSGGDVRHFFLQLRRQQQRHLNGSPLPSAHWNQEIGAL